MKIHFVTVCLDYDDYLYYTLPHNIKIIGDSGSLTVLTAFGRNKVINICSDNSVKFIEFESPTPGKCLDHFRVKCYNQFLLENKESWICLIDSDILLPRNTIEILSEISDKSKLYYTSRVYLPMDYDCINKNIQIAKECKNFRENGWVELTPIAWGYFQLFYNSNNKTMEVIDGVGADIMFANKHVCEYLDSRFVIAHIPHGTWDDWGKNYFTGERKTARIM